VDGELPLRQLYERAKLFGLNKDVRLISPENIAPKKSINLLEPQQYAKLEQAIDAHIQGKPGVVILDSQATLMGGDALKSQFQEQRMKLLRDLRWKGLCVLEMHHSGKNVEMQRGSSRNDDILDVQIQLSPPTGWEPGQGLAFDWKFEKVRHSALLEGGFTVSMKDGLWTKRVSDDQLAVMSCLQKGMSIAKIARELDIHPSKVKRLKAKVDKAGVEVLNKKKETHGKGN
jgi:putative DNA primase/helicase